MTINVTCENTAQIAYIHAPKYYHLLANTDSYSLALNLQVQKYSFNILKLFLVLVLDKFGDKSSPASLVAGA
jgi:hypothetical protein